MPRWETTFRSNARDATMGFEEARVTLPLLSHPGSELPRSQPGTRCYLPRRRPARPQAQGNLALTPGPKSNHAEAAPQGAELERGPRFAACCTPQPAPSKLPAWVVGMPGVAARAQTKDAKGQERGLGGGGGTTRHWFLPCSPPVQLTMTAMAPQARDCTLIAERASGRVQRSGRSQDARTPGWGTL